MRLDRNRRTKGVALAALTAAVLLGGCADGDNSPQNTTSGAGSTTQSSSESAQPSTPAQSTEVATTVAGCKPAPKVPGKKPDLTLPSKAEAQGKTFTATVETNCGNVVLELDGTKAPQTVASFIQLSKSFYNDSPCHRLVQGFVLQCGDPTGTGTGGPGYMYGLENTPADNKYPRGTLAMARQGENAKSNGGQFFITLADVPIPADSAGGYTIFGKVLSGMNIVDNVAKAGNGADGVAPKQAISILKITVSEKKA